MAPRWIDLEGAANARAVLPGVLLRSDNLQSLTEGDVRTLVDEHGVEVVLDLRTDIEVSLEGPGLITREPRIRIEHRSLYPDSGGHTDFELDALRPWQRLENEEPAGEPPAVRSYFNYLLRRPDSVVGSIRTIAQADGAALVHCAAGKDRTGVVVALTLAAADVDREVIVADYMATGDRIEAILDRLLASPTYRTELHGQDPASRAPRPGTMERLLEAIDRHFGGAAEWLLANGMEHGDLDRLRARVHAAVGDASGA